MQITVKGKQTDVGDALRGHVETRLSDAVSKYFSRPIEAQLVLSREAHLFRADITVHPGRNILIQGHSAAAEPYAAVDSAIEHVEKRVRRYKRRLKDHHNHDKAVDSETARYQVIQPEAEEIAAEEPPAEPAGSLVVAEMTTEVPTLSVSDAVMRLDLGDLPALLFRHAGHGGLNLVYRRRDGNVGWVDPANGPAGSQK